jgi:hypothetical protein
MAIKNASDLLVYAKTTNPAAQVTRIYVKTATPFILLDGQTTGTVKINNITNNSGVVSDDVSTASFDNTGADALAKIGSVLAGSSGNGYSATTTAISGDYSYRDFTNGANGIVPTLEITNGTATFEENVVIIEIITPGSSAIFDPVAFSTSASFSTNMDLRDVTNKDSDGWSESLGGLKSFEVSTDILQSINPDVPLDGTDFFDKLKTRSLVDLSFSDRIRNILRTNLTQSGVDGFGKSSGTQTNLQADPFGGSTASKFTTAASTSFKFVKYTTDSARLEGKNVNWSFYIKGSGSTTSASITVSNIATAQSAIITKLEGSGSIAQAGVGSQYWNITGLSTSNWTRVSFQMNNLSTSGGSESDPQDFRFVVYPGVYNSQDSSAIFISSWQVELSSESTDYQDPTDITHWQGNALVSSVSFDAGVEDNLTCSATFTGTGNVYPNGLGPELIGDTGFDLANDGSNPASAYWSVFGASRIADGYGKILFTAGGAISGIEKTGLMTTPGDYYLLTYTVSGSPTPEGTLIVTNGWDQDPSDTQPQIPITSGTHKVLLKPGQTSLQIKRNSSTVDTTVWLSSISLKKVL